MGFRSNIFLGFGEIIVFGDVGSSVIFCGGFNVIVVLEKRDYCSLLEFLRVNSFVLRFIDNRE